MALADWRSTEVSTYPFTAMNTFKGQRIRTASSAGNTVALENWFNIDKIHKIYQHAPVPLQHLRLEEVYLLAAPPGLPIRLVRLDGLTSEGQADLFDVQRQETITVNLGPEYQLHKYFPDAVIRRNLNMTNGMTHLSNFESVGGGKAKISSINRMRRRTKKGGGGKLVNLSRVNMSKMYSPALGKSNLNVLLNRINSEMKGTRKNSRNVNIARKNNFTFNNPKRSSK